MAPVQQRRTMRDVFFGDLEPSLREGFDEVPALFQTRDRHIVFITLGLTG